MSIKDKMKTIFKKDELTQFTMGVDDSFKLKNSKDIVVTGKLNGTVKEGDAVYVNNFSNDGEEEILLTKVMRIEVGPGNTQNKASDCNVALMLEGADSFPFRCGTIVYSEDVPNSKMQDAYISTLGDYFVSRKQLVLTQDELDSMSITDCAETWRLYSWFRSKVIPAKTQEERDSVMQKIEKLAEAMISKLLSGPAIYCVYSRITGEPAMFSDTIDRQDGTYMCTPPDIWLLTKPYKDIIGATFPADKYEIKEIKNNANKDAIRDFLGYCFYMNGACGVRLVNKNTSIAAEKIVEKPDYSDVPEINRPVMNPDLERWLLLIAELGHPDNEDQELIYKLYINFMSKELLKAKLLIPMKLDGSIPKPDENGETVLKKDTTFALATINGKKDRDAVRMYTDWKRLRHGMKDDDWQGFIQPVEGMIGTFDCAINLTEFDKAGCYIDQEMFDNFNKS